MLCAHKRLHFHYTNSTILDNLWTVPLPKRVRLHILAVIHAVQPLWILWWIRSRAMFVTSMATESVRNLVFLFSLVINQIVFQGSSVEMITRSTQTCWNGIYYMIILENVWENSNWRCPCLNVFVWVKFMRSDETCWMLFGIFDRSAIRVLCCRKCTFLKGADTTSFHGRGSSWPVWTRGLWPVILALIYTAASFDIQTSINDVYLFFNAGVLEGGGSIGSNFPWRFTQYSFISRIPS